MCIDCYKTLYTCPLSWFVSLRLIEADPESASKALLEDMHSSSTGISRSLSSSSSSSSAAIKQKDPVLHHDGQSDSEDDFLVPKSSAGETKSSVQVDSDDEEVLRYRNLISGKVNLFF